MDTSSTLLFAVPGPASSKLCASDRHAESDRLQRHHDGQSAAAPSVTKRAHALASLNSETLFPILPCEFLRAAG